MAALSDHMLTFTSLRNSLGRDPSRPGSPPRLHTDFVKQRPQSVVVSDLDIEFCTPLQQISICKIANFQKAGDKNTTFTGAQTMHQNNDWYFIFHFPFNPQGITISILSKLPLNLTTQTKGILTVTLMGLHFQNSSSPSGSFLSPEKD